MPSSWFQTVRNRADAAIDAVVKPEVEADHERQEEDEDNVDAPSFVCPICQGLFKGCIFFMQIINESDEASRIADPDSVSAHGS